jgi:rfaE bifunctional protein kinase chain/domain
MSTLPSKKELLQTLEKIPGCSILVVGDLMLDRYIWGKVDRISPEAPVPVVEVQSIEDRLGGAGNVVRNLCNLGVKVTVCGYVGDDEEGATVLKLLRESNVDKDGVIIDREHPTSLKTRVVAHPQQIVRIDREDKSPRSAPLQNAFASLIESHFTANDVAGVIVSDYAKGAISPIIMNRFSENSIKGILGRKTIPLVIDPHPSNYSLYKNITIAKPNRKEAEAAAGMKITDHKSALEAAQIIMEKWNSELMMITLGEGGMVIAEKGIPGGVCLDTVAQEVFDVSGAGDTVTSVFTAALAVGASVAVAGQLSNVAAGYVVSEVGTVAIDLARLKSEVEALP